MSPLTNRFVTTGSSPTAIPPSPPHPPPLPPPLFLVKPPPLVEPLEVSSDSSGLAEGDDPVVDDTAAPRRPPHLETPPGFPPQSSSPPLQPVAVDFGAGLGGGGAGGVGSGGAGSGGAGSWGAGSGVAGSGGAGSGGAEPEDAVSGGAERSSDGGVDCWRFCRCVATSATATLVLGATAIVAVTPWVRCWRFRCWRC
ncbi:unnamed protein product [Closterium sp. NIES-54]